MATPVITLYGRGATRINKGRGLKVLTGKIVLSAHSAFATSNIEKFFRKCHDIKVTVQKSDGNEAVVPVWDNSTTHKHGILRTYGQSTAGGVSALVGFGLAASGTFVAFGS